MSSGARIPIGDEIALYEHLRHAGQFHPYFHSAWAIFFRLRSRQRKSRKPCGYRQGRVFRRHAVFFRVCDDSDVIRITGYLVKKSDIEKLARGEAVQQDNVIWGLGEVRNSHILSARFARCERRARQPHHSIQQRGRPRKRTVFFFQGCNFNMRYCHNPETIVYAATAARAFPSARPCDSDGGRRCALSPGVLLRLRRVPLRLPEERFAEVDWMEPEEGIECFGSIVRSSAGLPYPAGMYAAPRVCHPAVRGRKEMGLHTLMDSNGNYDFSADEPLLRVATA